MFPLSIGPTASLAALTPPPALRTCVPRPAPGALPQRATARMRLSHLEQQLGDLHGVGGGALAHLVARDEHLDAMRRGLAVVLPQAPHQHVVLVGREQWLRERVARAVVDDLDARRGAQDLARLVDGQRPVEGEVDRLAVRAQHRHAHAGRRHRDGVRLEDLGRLLDHLRLLLVVARLGVHVAVVREDVEDVLPPEDVLRDR
mmetsp:Transcript_7269/g.25979  ORF Transcript_7269/g.25979 Transcript_7269/m.25979 type:complete len:202 (+) Transcript_7269:1378-1983(+)